MARILVCSDDAVQLETLTAQVAAVGHEVLVAHDGLAAREAATTAKPDLIFLSEDLSVFDAYEVCRMLRDDPDIPALLPVVLLPRDRPDPRRVEAAGFTDLFSPHEGGAQLHDLLVRHLGPLSNAQA